MKIIVGASTVSLAAAVGLSASLLGTPALAGAATVGTAGSVKPAAAPATVHPAPMPPISQVPGTPHPTGGPYPWPPKTVLSPAPTFAPYPASQLCKYIPERCKK